ncbi:hypothetical protein BDF21DRAFT_439179 [Thamnidium elegans]|nr:hypothetical protein BDF21DRAFT_439179 [Thamnidium elegans]
MPKNIDNTDLLAQINQETEASTSRGRGQALARQLVAYNYEDVGIVDGGKVYVQGLRTSVESVIKTEAYKLRSQYHSLPSNKKAIVSLGLNSIIDLSFASRHSQTTLLKPQQWSELKKMFRPKAYRISDYNDIKEILRPAVKSYKDNRTFNLNWLAMNKKIKELEREYDLESNASNKDVSFCIHLLLQVLLIIKYQPSLFNDQIVNSECDFIFKFWGVTIERLFCATNFHLKWKDTYLTMHNIISNTNFKVDPRIVNDKIYKRYNTGNDIAVAEVVEHDSGDAKFIGDRVKVSIENKTSGLYVSTEFCHYSITNSLSNFSTYVDLAIQLLCFRDACISNSNLYDNHFRK